MATLKAVAAALQSATLPTGLLGQRRKREDPPGLLIGDMPKDAPAHQDLLSTQQKPIGSSQLQMLPPGGLTSDNDQSPDVECTGAELSHQALGTPQTLDLQTCYICQGTSDQESIMICDRRGCSVIAHLNCYFSAGSQDANDAITDIEHWHCENCGGLPRHMHPRPQASKRARVSFDPGLPTPMAATSAQPVSTTHPSGVWGGHWPIRTAMPPTAKGKGKEAMEPGLPHWGALPPRPIPESEQDSMSQAVRSKRPGSPLLLPPPLFLCMQRPTRMQLVCLMYALSLAPKLWSLKGSFRTLESQVPRGSIYPTGTRFHIPDFSLISGSPGDKASTRSRGPAARVTCHGHGNQDSPLA